MLMNRMQLRRLFGSSVNIRVMANSNISPPISSEERQRLAKHSTWVSIYVNLLLTAVQITVGWLARSQALMADGLHSLSDLVSDGVVLFATRHAGKDADEDHPYGHARFETAASLFLGGVLMVVGIGMCWTAAERLQDPSSIPRVAPLALWLALFALVAKEVLFRYMLAIGERLRSSLLIANAWHARSDAASSLVVALGIGGNLAGFHLADTLAAAAVGFMVARMGWQFGFDAFSDLTDRGLEPDAVAAIRQTLLNTPGVDDVHELRTRKMGDFAVVDAHLRVAPTLSVSEGHRIAESARQAVQNNHRSLDVLIHIDPEDDDLAPTVLDLPDRDALLAQIHAATGGKLARDARVILHYLDGQVEIDLLLQRGLDEQELARLSADVQRLLGDAPHLRDIRIHQRLS